VTDRLRITVDPAAVPVLHLDGSLDRRTTPLLRAEAARLLLDDALDLVVDLAAVEQVDAAGLRALLDIRRRLPDGGQLVVSDARPEVRRLLEITALDRSLLVLDESLVPLAPTDRPAPAAGPAPPGSASHVGSRL
jgi:anti-anti-sigma factor